MGGDGQGVFEELSRLRAHLRVSRLCLSRHICTIGCVYQMRTTFF